MKSVENSQYEYGTTYNKTHVLLDMNVGERLIDLCKDLMGQVAEYEGVKLDPVKKDG